MEKFSTKSNNGYDLSEPPYNAAEKQYKRDLYFRRTLIALFIFSLIMWLFYHFTKPNFNELSKVVDKVKEMQQQSKGTQFNEAGERIKKTLPTQNSITKP